MNRIKVIDGVLTVHPGAEVRLSEGQAIPRAHKLEALKGRSGRYKVLDPVQFKTGEVLAVSEIAKAQRPQVELLDAAEAA